MPLDGQYYRNYIVINVKKYERTVIEIYVLYDVSLLSG